MDYPVSAGTKGSLMFLNGVTDEMLQAYRDKVFQVCKQDLVDVTAKLVNQVHILCVIHIWDTPIVCRVACKKISLIMK